MLLEAINSAKIVGIVRQAKALKKEILISEELFATAKDSLSAVGVKYLNLASIVGQIKSSSTPLEETHFSKSGTGVLSISPNQTNQLFDHTIQEILAPLIPRDITSAGVEMTRKSSLAAVSASVLKYGVKKPEFEAVLTKILSVDSQINYYVYSEEGYLLEFGEVENSTVVIDTTQKVILKFEVTGSQGSLMMDPSVGSDFPTASVTFSGSPGVAQIDGRNVAVFSSVGEYSYARITSVDRFVQPEKPLSIELDFRYMYDDQYIINSTYSMLIDLLFLSGIGQVRLGRYSQQYGLPENSVSISFHTGSYQYLTIPNIRNDRWYKLKLDFWYEGNYYRKQMTVTDLTTNEKFYAKNNYSTPLTDIPSVDIRVGNYTYAYNSLNDCSVYVDNMYIKTANAFIKPVITKAFDSTKTNSALSLSNSKKDLSISTPTTSWSSALSEEENFTGKRYFEVTNLVNDENSFSGSFFVGIVPHETDNSISDFYPGKYSGSFGLLANRSSGLILFFGTGSQNQFWNVGTPAGFLIGAGQVVRVAVDLDQGKLVFGIGDYWVGNYGNVYTAQTYGSESAAFVAAIGGGIDIPYNNIKRLCVAIKGTTQKARLNVGADPFAFPLPDQFVAWGDIGVI